MSDYLSRHPSPSIENNQIKAEELWNDWLTVNKIDEKKLLLDEQNRQRKENQPIRDKTATESERTKEKERPVENANQPIREQITTVKQTTKASERTDSAEKEVLCKQEKQTIKSIIASINTPNSMSNQSDSDLYEQSTIDFADKPPLKTRICYSFNQIEFLQNLGNYTFATQFEAYNFLQNVIALVKCPEAAKISRLPAPWREKFRCFSLDSNEFLYMDERLVIPKLLPPIILRSLHYGHGGRDSMLVTVANVWWPRLHREVLRIAQTCQQCKTAGKNIKPLLRQTQIGKLPKRTEINQAIVIDFAGLFQNAKGAKKYLLVSVDHYSGWPEAKFLRKPNTE